MSAFMIATITVKDREKFAEYLAKTQAVAAPHGSSRRYFNDPSLIYPVVKIGTKAQAIGFLLRMLATKAPDLDAWEHDRGYPLLNNPALAQDSAEWRGTAERQQLSLLPAASCAAPDLELIV